MRFVPVKTPDQQSVMMLHRVRLMLNRQRTQLSNAMRAHMAEFGVVAPVGRMGLERLLAIVDDHEDQRIPADARVCLAMLAAQLAVVKTQVLENDRRIRESARETEVGRRLMAIPGVGPLLASAFVARSPIQPCSRQGMISPHGSASCRSRTRAAAKSGSEGSRERATAICGRCWSSARWRLSGTRSATAPSGHGFSSCSPGAPPRWRRSR